MRPYSVVLGALIAMAGPIAGQCPVEWSRNFGPGGFDNPTWTSIVHDDGSGPKLYVGGSFLSADGTAASRIARFDGQGWEPVGGGFNGPVYALHVHDFGAGPRLVAGGLFGTAGGSPAANVAAWDGTSWSALGAGTGGRVDALASFAAGGANRLFAGGTFTTAGGAPALRLAAFDGAAWSPAGAGFDAGVEALEVFDDGSGAALYAGGSFTASGVLATPGVARWNGAAIQPAGAGLLRPVHDLLVFDDGAGPRLFAGTRSGALAATTVVAAWDGVSWTDPGAGGCCLSPGLGEIFAKSLAVHDDGTGPALYAGGSSMTVPGSSIGITNVARWNGAAWSPVGATIGIVEALAGFDDGTGPALYACGGIATPMTRGIARWQGGTLWSHLGLVAGGFDDQVLCFAYGDAGSGPALFAGGRFFKAGNTVTVRIATLTSDVWQPLPGLSNTGYGIEQIAVLPPALGGGLAAAGDFFIDVPGTLNDQRAFLSRWNGSGWTSLLPGLAPYTWSAVRRAVVHDAGSGPELFVAANILQGQTVVGTLARWNGASFALVAGAPTIEDLAVFDDGTGPKLFAVARDVPSPAGPQRGIVRWDGTAWALLAGGLPPLLPFFGQPARITFHDDGTGPAFYVAGSFSSVAGIPANGIARWNGTWSALPAGSGTNVFTSLASWNDGSGPALYAGGDLQAVGSLPPTHVARWGGGAWSDVGQVTMTSAPPAYLYALLPYTDTQGSRLMVGGHFLTAGGFNAWRVTRLAAPAPSLEILQPGPALPLTVRNDGLCSGGVYYNLVSADLCPVGPGTGPYAGLCYGNPQDLIFQLLLPVGAVPFHFAATGSSSLFGPYLLPAGLAFDVVCVDASGGVFRSRSAVRRILVF